MIMPFIKGVHYVVFRLDFGRITGLRLRHYHGGVDGIPRQVG